MDRAFFASVPSSGIDFNSVSITWFVEKNEEEILMDLQKEKEEMEMEKLDAGKENFIFFIFFNAKYLTVIDF